MSSAPYSDIIYQYGDNKTHILNHHHLVDLGIIHAVVFPRQLKGHILQERRAEQPPRREDVKRTRSGTRDTTPRARRPASRMKIINVAMNDSEWSTEEQNGESQDGKEERERWDRLAEMRLVVGILTYIAEEGERGRREAAVKRVDAVVNEERERAVGQAGATKAGDRESYTGLLDARGTKQSLGR